MKTITLTIEYNEHNITNKEIIDYINNTLSNYVQIKNYVDFDLLQEYKDNIKILKEICEQGE